MGKAAREANKTDRLRRQAKLLSELTGMIAKLWDVRPECVEAAALFLATAERLGIPLRARAVSILAVDTQDQKASMTGLAAGAEAERRLGGIVLGSPKDVSDQSFERAGHMILTSSVLSMMFDPTFQQFSKEGLPGRPIFGPVADVDPPTGELLVEFGGGRFEVTYFFDDANLGWQEGFDWAKKRWAEAAGLLAVELRSGGTAANMMYEISWDEQPAR